MGRCTVERVERVLVKWWSKRVSLGMVKNLIFGKVEVSVRDPCMKLG